MKKIILSILTATSVLPLMAQRYVIVDDDQPILASEIDRISYEANPKFHDDMLMEQLASDPKTSLFTQALRLTGFADSLQSFIFHADYAGHATNDDFYYRADFWNEYASYNPSRPKRYTVFAETDDVYAAEGIITIEQLKAYASKVYDELYPEDATVSNPTDCRNSLNRFVAYHILPQATSYYYLTVYDGNMLGLCFDRKLTDIAAWYGTLLPCASLKCSYPDAGADTGLYLNRRGLKAGPDKYGSQVRGAKIVADDNNNFDHETLNGYYFLIDRILTYDRQTREEVLGGERWRVDFKTLSPDIMNNAPELRGNYLVDDSSSDPDKSGKNGRNISYDWNSIQNITNHCAKPGQFIHRRAHCNFWSWQGDEVIVQGDFDMTIKLPPLPAGEWEVRMGYCALGGRAKVKVFLDGQEVVDTLDMTKAYDASNPNMKPGPRECAHFSASGQQQRFSDTEHLVRFVPGRLQSDGKKANYLRLQKCQQADSYNAQGVFDYFEFVPKAIVDNTAVPEE